MPAGTRHALLLLALLVLLVLLVVLLLLLLVLLVLLLVLLVLLPHPRRQLRLATWLGLRLGSVLGLGLGLGRGLGLASPKPKAKSLSLTLSLSLSLATVAVRRRLVPVALAAHPAAPMARVHRVPHRRRRLVGVLRGRATTVGAWRVRLQREPMWWHLLLVLRHLLVHLRRWRHLLVHLLRRRHLPVALMLLRWPAHALRRQAWRHARRHALRHARVAALRHALVLRLLPVALGRRVARRRPALRPVPHPMLRRRRRR